MFNAFGNNNGEFYETVPDDIFVVEGEEVVYDEGEMDMEYHVLEEEQFLQEGHYEVADYHDVYMMVEEDEWPMDMEEEVLVERATEDVLHIEPIEAERRLERNQDQIMMPPMRRFSTGTAEHNVAVLSELLPTRPGSSPIANAGFPHVQLKMSLSQKPASNIPPRTRHVFNPPPPSSARLPLTPLPDRFFERRETVSGDRAGFTSECIRCERCGGLFQNQNKLKIHQKKEAEGLELGDIVDQTGLTCPFPSCTIKCDKMATVIAHMTTSHSVEDLVFEKVRFHNKKEFEVWKLALEQLTHSKFTTKSGRLNVHYNTKYFYCQHSGKPPIGEEEKERVRGSKKLGKMCTAFFQIKELEDGSVILRGCFKHYGHEMDVRQLPLTAKIRMDIANLLIEGLGDAEIVKKMESTSTPGDREHYIRPYEVRNVAKKLEYFIEDYKRKVEIGMEVPNLAATFELTDQEHIGHEEEQEPSEFEEEEE